MNRLIGRDRELAALLAALGERDSRCIAVVGEAGIGKTRLLDEVVAHADGPRRSVLSPDPPMTRGCLGAVGRVRVDRPRILVVTHLGRGRSALANGHGGEAPRGSVDSG